MYEKKNERTVSPILKFIKSHVKEVFKDQQYALHQQFYRQYI